jgi:hypothetical protein
VKNEYVKIFCGHTVFGQKQYVHKKFLHIHFSLSASFHASPCAVLFALSLQALRPALHAKGPSDNDTSHNDEDVHVLVYSCTVHHTVCKDWYIQHHRAVFSREPDSSQLEAEQVYKRMCARHHSLTTVYILFTERRSEN